MRKNIHKKLNLLLGLIALIGFITLFVVNIQVNAGYPTEGKKPTPTPTHKPKPSKSPTPFPTEKPTKTPSPSPISKTPTPTQMITSTPTTTPHPTSPPSNGGDIGGVSNPTPCPDQKPNQPTNIKVQTDKKGQATLSWTAPEGPVSDYSITYSDAPDSQKWGIVSIGNVTTFTVSDLGEGKYYFWVTAVNGCMPGNPTGPVSANGVGGGPAVLGLSTTSSDAAVLFQHLRFIPSLLLAGVGFYFLKTNAKKKN